MTSSIWFAALVPLAFGLVMTSLRPFVARHVPSGSTFAAMGPLFLFSRRPVIAAVTLAGLAGALWMATISARHGHASIENGLASGVIGLSSGGGFGLMVVGIVFFGSALTKSGPALALSGDEVKLYERAANHYLAGEARGGRLFVTSRRLYFRPHRFNVQLAPWSVALEQVTKLEALDDRVLGVSDANGRALLVVASRRLVTYVRELSSRTEAQRRAENESLLRLADL